MEILSHTAEASFGSHVGFERLGVENILSFLDTGKVLTAVKAHLVCKSTLCEGHYRIIYLHTFHPAK